VEKFLVGEMVKKLREQRGISQTELGEPFMCRTHISKIERGLTLPSKTNLTLLLEKLGYDIWDFPEFFLDESEAKFENALETLGSLLKQKEINKARELLEQLEKDGSFMKKITYKQRLLSHKATIAISNEEPPSKIREILLDALKISIPNFDEERISEYWLSQITFGIIDKIAIVYNTENEVDKAINLRKMLWDNLKNQYRDHALKAKLTPSLAYNLASGLHKAAKYEEAIDLCDEGIKSLRHVNSIRVLPLIMLIKAYCLYEIGDTQICKKLLRQSYYSNEMLGRFDILEIIKNYAQTKELDIVF